MAKKDEPSKAEQKKILARSIKQRIEDQDPDDDRD